MVTIGTAAATEHVLGVGDTTSLTRRIRRHPLRLTLVADAVAALSAIAIADLAGADPSRRASLVITALWLAMMLAAHAYEPMPTGFGEMRWRRVLRAAAGLGLACWVLSAAVPDLATPGQLVLLTATLTVGALTHRAVTRGLRLALHSPLRPTPVLVAGDPDDVRRVLVELRRGKPQLWDVVGVCLTHEPPDAEDTFGDARYAVDDLVLATSLTGAEAAIAMPCPTLDPGWVRRLSWQLERTGVHLFLGTGMLDVSTSRATLVRGGDLGMVHVRPVPHGGAAHLVKAVTERLAAAFALLVAAPVLAAVALAVRLDTSGPAIFRQTRVGADGREFTMLKFRSMSDGAHATVAELADRNETGGVLFKIRADPRITRVGGFLRRYSLDELPQLWNVVRGDMALVGPRPALPEEVARYDADARRRLAVRPGLTGLWQVSGRSDLTWEDTVRLDLHYVDNWSFVLDLGIVLRTVRTVLSHRGAY